MGRLPQRSPGERIPTSDPSDRTSSADYEAEIAPSAGRRPIGGPMARRSVFLLAVLLLLTGILAPASMAWTSNGVQVNTGLFGGAVGEVRTLPDGAGGL